MKEHTVRTRSREEILRNIEWANNQTGGLEENIPPYRREVCESCGIIFDKTWRNGVEEMKTCLMCTP